VSCVARNGPIRDLGGKAFALARLDAAELPIPEWFAVTPVSFARSVTVEQQRALASGQIESVQDALTHLEAAADVCAEIDAAVRNLAAHCGARFAVRSSAVDEDGAESSFAGQLASYLFVDADSVVRRVADVWRSGFSERIFEYRRQRGMTAPLGAPAVLVQRMIDADASGVAFSADPVSGRRGLAVISAVHGIGTALVGGEGDADVYEVDRTGRIERQTIAHKQLRHGFAAGTEEGVSAQSVQADEMDRPALSSAHATAVAALARRAAVEFGQPQDIEWAIEDGSLYLLQSRPITTLRNLPDPDGALNIWDNSNITESYNGVTSPLTFSFARSVYEGVYRQFCAILRVPQRKIEANDLTFRCMLGLIQGRIYYNLLNWYRVLALLPGFTVNRRFMEQMMGVRESLPDEIAAGLDKATARQRFADIFSLTGMILALVKNLLTLDGQVKRFYARLHQALQEPDPPLTEMRLDELMAHYSALEEKLLTHWDAPLINDFFAMIFHGTLRKLAQKWCEDTNGMLANDAIRGQGGMISAEPAARVTEMASIAANDTGFTEALCQAPLEEILRAVRDHSEFRAKYEDYLAKFGDRCMEELKLESETLHENPLVLLRGVGELARAPISAPRTSAHSDVAADAVKQMRASLRGSPFRVWLLMWVLRKASVTVRQRENLRFERTRLFGRVRRIFREAGKRLHAMGVLETADDIFYLQVEEIRSYVAGNGVTADLKPLVALRKAEFQRYRESDSPPARFETTGAVYHAQSYRAKATSTSGEGDGKERHGIGCCPGTVRGIVRVVRDPRNAQLPAGSILVADHTDPGWIMLFPSAKGLLVERGSLLSHSAIVARELGIPAVVSIPGLTSWLQDGDEVELDGARGTVRLVSAEGVHA
jgi:pyruvate,water dikinase